MGEATLTFFFFAFCAVCEPATNIGLHGVPKILAGERGMDLGVGKVMEVGMVLAGKGFAESRKDQNP